MGFNDIIGHENIKKEIVNSINSGRFTHSHIFSGVEGIGKTPFARETAKLILNKDFDKTYADFYEYKKQDDKLSIGIKEVLSVISEVNKKPFEGDKKVVLIHDADKMTEEAQNAFLKTIEEPPEGVYIFLLCEDTGKILNTIISRCSIHSFYKLGMNEIKQLISKKYPNLAIEFIDKLSLFSDGILGLAEKFMEDENYKKQRNTIIDILNCLKERENNLTDFEKTANINKNDYKIFLSIFLSYIRDLIVYKETLKECLIMNFDKTESIKEISEKLSLKKMYNYISIINSSAELIENNVNSNLVLYTMLYKMQDA